MSTRPSTSLFIDSYGDVIGVGAGGPYSEGVVFKIIDNNGVYDSTPTILVYWADNGTQGSLPYGRLLIDASGNMFGTTAYGGDLARPSLGGAAGGGTVYEIKNNNGVLDSTPTVLVRFNASGSGGTNPFAGLVEDANGDLFGTTQQGGPGGVGEVFEVKINGGVYDSTPTVLVTFNTTNGAYPAGELQIDGNGNLFGASSYGGTNNYGNLFEVKATATGYDSTPTIIVNFNSALGGVPTGSPVADANGVLFGFTQGVNGSSTKYGGVYEISGGIFASSPASVPPTVTSINRSGAAAALTNASSVSFTVTFSAAVSGVLASNFSLSGTDGTGSIGTPTTSNGGLSWTVVVGSVAGNGTLALDLSAVSGIVSVADGTAMAATHPGDQAYTIDTIPPAAPVISGITSGTDTGASSTDGVTKNTTPTLAGTAEANSTVAIWSGGVQVGTATTNGAGAWSFTIPAALSVRPEGLRVI